MAKIPIRPDSVRVLGVYTPAFKVSDGDLIIMSGVVGVDSDGNTVGVGDAAAQTRQALANLKTTLEAAGATLEDVIHVRVFSTDLRNRPAINAERRNSGTVPLGNGKFTRPPLPLDLRYLITPWVKDTSDAHTVCGYIMRALHDNDSLGPSDLVGNSWADDDTLQIVLESLPVAEHYDIWQPTGLPYRLSLSYLARVIGLDSGIISSAAPVITANFGGP